MPKRADMTAEIKEILKRLDEAGPPVHVRPPVVYVELKVTAKKKKEGAQCQRV